MFTSSNSGHNRLLALEQELMGWKTSPKPQQGQQQQENKIPDSEAETEQVAAWDSESEETEELEEAGEAEQLSYGSLAKMLQSNASQRFRRNVTQLQALGDGLESLEEEEETVFAYPSRQDTFSSASILSNQDAINAFEFSQLPELDLPMSDRATSSFPDIPLPEAEEYTPSPVSSNAFSGEEPSYTSLLQILQAAKQGNTTDESEAQTLSTIDVESHALAEETAHSYPLAIPNISKLALTASVEQPLLSAARSTDAMALALEPIELEPIPDEEFEDWWDEPSDD